VQHDGLPRSQRVAEHGLGKVLAPEARLPQIDLDVVVAHRDLGFDPIVIVARENEEPRSAPACSMAVRISVSISFSSTISPDTASDTLITVARSRWSTWAWIVVVASGVERSP
jgi:hypothetical protein